jgi:predicted kinase
MREWMRALMRRRGKRGVNDSESTGKIGQEIPVDQPTPLQPMYPVRKPARAPEPPVTEAEITPPAVDFPPADEVAAASEIYSPATSEGKLVVETQPESPSVPPPELASASPKDLKGYVVLAIGLPGSGKTTWFKRRGVTPLSSDMLRSILFDDITEQRYQGLVFSTLRSLLRARLIAKMPWNYVDATNLSAHERRQWIKMAKSFGYEAQAVFFDVPLEVCMERNSRRERTVSDDIMRKMAERLRPPSFKEGFTKITMVRVKGAPPLKLDGVEVEPPPAASE